MTVYASCRRARVAYRQDLSASVTRRMTCGASRLGMFVRQGKFRAIMIETNPLPLRRHVTRLAPPVRVHAEVFRVDVLVAGRTPHVTIPGKLPLPHPVKGRHAMTSAALDRQVAPAEAKGRLSVLLDGECRRNIPLYGMARCTRPLVRARGKLSAVGV
jgi:hypothetical protein